MAHHRSNKNGSKGSSNSSDPPPNSLRKVTVSIGQPFTIRQESTAEDKKQYAEEQEDRKESLALAKRLNWITLGGIFVAILSIGAVYLTLRQSERNMRIDQRAWIGVKHVDYATIQGSFGVMMQLENTGKTPALNVRTHQHIDELPEGFPFDFSEDYKFSEFNGPEIFGPVAPGSTPNVGYGETNTTGLIPIIASAKVFAYFHGRIAYNDAFGHEHWVVFCFYAQRRPAPDVTVGWQPCGKNNQIDNDME